MNIFSDILLDQFRGEINFSPVDKMNDLADEEIAFDYFEFNNSVSSVYFTKTVDDLFNAYVL